MPWFEQFWNFVNSKFASDFERIVDLKLHLMPVENGTKLALLDRNLPVIYVDEYNSMVEIFEKLQISVLKFLPSYVLGHDNMKKYVLKNNLNGLLEALSRRMKLNRISYGCVAQMFDTFTEEERNELRKFIGWELYKDEQICSDHKQLMRALPIFKTYHNSGFEKSHFNSFKNVPLAVCNTCSIPVPTSSKLLHLSDEFSRKIATFLDAEILSDAKVLVKYVFPLIHFKEYSNTEVVVEVMKFVLNKLDTFSKEMDDFCYHVKHVKFITQRSESLESPGNLYDGNDDILRNLFDGVNRDVFPCGEFSALKYRPQLIRVGMKRKEDIKIEDFDNIAQMLNKSTISPVSLKSASALMTLLNTFVEADSNADCKLYLERIKFFKWVLCQKTRPQGYPEWLPFCGEKECLVPPNNVISDEFICVVGSVQATLNVSNFGELSKWYGWQNRPNIEMVLKHLNNIICASEAEEITMSSLWKACEPIYDFLNIVASENNTELVTKVRDHLSNKNFILVDGQFLNPNQCAIKCSLGQTCFPLLCSLPTYLVEYSSLWKTIEIKEQFALDDFLEILEETHKQTENKQLTDKQLHIVLQVVRECVNMNSNEPVNKKVYLPDSNNVLQLSSELHYDDTPWIEKDDQMLTCHPLIPYLEANILGVTSNRQYAIKSSEIKLPGFEFGQSEKLVTRLKRILTCYPLDFGILKEFIQNADDAGATKIHFILT